jgi:hypothetical protein
MAVAPGLRITVAADRRADIQASGYRGLRAPATRVVGTGNMLVLFDGLCSDNPPLHEIRENHTKIRSNGSTHPVALFLHNPDRSTIALCVFFSMPR